MGLSPKQICNELDKYIIGQDHAKRAVAIALRNRYRRSMLSDELKEEITPKNIIMRGPTGVGKTEIARRLAKLVKAPFIKVEATKFTEVGYVGRDVESMVRDLVEMSIRMVKDEKRKTVVEKAKAGVDKRLIEAVCVGVKAEQKELTPEGKEAVINDFKAGKYEDYLIEIDVVESTRQVDVIGGGMEINFQDMLGSIFPPKKHRRKLKVKQARELLFNEEADKLIDQDSVNAEAIRRAEQDGIIFIDEIDKIASTTGSSHGTDVSREGVQRDILPIVEGCTVSTKYGQIRTDYILFIASGAFHVSNIEDLIPELQGRFPIRVDLDNLTRADFLKILTQPQNAIVKQYQELLKIDQIDLNFDEGALETIAEIAEQENETSENIGARRLHTVMEELLEDISFNADGEVAVRVDITKDYVENIFKGNISQYDLKKYIL